jgi:ferredoxin
MKVFGQPITKGLIIRIHNPRVEITIIGNKMRIKLSDSSILPVFEKQLSRALNCVGCGACVGVCDFRALKISAGEIRIGEQCNGCLRCVTSNGIRMSCVSVNYKPEVLVVA